MQASCDHGRHGQVLELTGAGRRVLARVTESRRAVFRERLAHWPQEDLARFADYLVRYNEGPGPGGRD